MFTHALTSDHCVLTLTGCYYVSSSRSPLDSYENQNYCLSSHRTTSCSICIRSVVAPTWKFKCLFQVLNILVIYNIFISFTRNISKEIITIIIISFTAIFENSRVLLWSEGYNHDQKVAVNKQEQKIKCRKWMENEEGDRWQADESSFVGSLPPGTSAEHLFCQLGCPVFCRVQDIFHFFEFLGFNRFDDTRVLWRKVCWERGEGKIYVLKNRLYFIFSGNIDNPERHL